MAEEYDRRGRRVTAAGTGSRRLARTTGGRPHVVTVKLSDAEYEWISARAIVAGISRQRLMVEAAMAPPTDTGGYVMTRSERNGLFAEFAGARRLVAAMSNNLNQLARTANATGQVPAELAAAAAAAQRALDRLTAATEATMPGRTTAAAPTPPPDDASDRWEEFEPM